MPSGDGRSETEAGDGLARAVGITRFGREGPLRTDDLIVREERFELFLNGRFFVAFACLPNDLEAFATGFLATEGLLDPRTRFHVSVDHETYRLDVSGEFDDESLASFSNRRTLTSGCGGGVTGKDIADPVRCLRVDTDLTVSPDSILAGMQRLREEASLYRLTGGAHIAALADGCGRLILTAQDIGRHTAVDKVIGKAILSGVEVSRCVLICSGRLSSEITLKALHARAPVLASRAAPTDLSVRLARRYLLTLVGFVRGHRMNVYSVPERIAG